MSKVVLITGAGAGMGKATALKYAKLNAKLSIADIDAKGLEETDQICSNLNGNNVLKTVIDLTKDEDVKDLVNNTISKFGRIDILINCAGIIRPSSIFDANLMPRYDKVMAINLRSIVLLTSLCAPYLIKEKGCVVNIASVLGVMASESNLEYSISKAGLIHFTKCVALELAAHGVRVNAILPGLVNSNLYINSGLSKDENEALFKSVAPTSALKHATETDEIADLVLYLASDKARSITGSCCTIDAGSMLTGFTDIKNLLKEE